MRKSKVIVLPYLRNTNIENTVSTSNVAYKNEKENFPKCDEYDEYDGYSIIYNELNNSISNIHGESQLIELFTQDKIYSDKRYLTKRVNSIKQNCLKLTKSINNLFQFQKIERKQLFSCKNNVNIVDIIDNIIVKSSEYIKNKIVFDTNIEEKYMSCDINMFQKAILILLFQAAVHSDENAIFVNLNVFEEDIRITVSFNSKESKLLDLFIEKLDNSMNDISDELSLELYLCKSLIAMHEGSISVGKNDDEIIFKIELPCRNTDYIYNLYTNYINNEYLTEQIQIEFSDLYEI